MSKKFTPIEFEFTNECTCVAFDEDENEIPCDDCWGVCWDNVIDDFTNITEHLFDKNETNWWKVKGLRLWYGDTAGWFYANDISQLIKGMTVDSSWIIRGKVFENKIEYSLSHHDAPMGSSSILTIVTEEKRETLGLY